jgi:hypothetical protein
LIVATLPTHAQAPTAAYTVEFQATWSEASHPIAFPANAHFSPLVGAVHDATVSFWAPGQLATPGIQDMAERGRTTPLDDEVGTAIASGGASHLLLGSSLEHSPGSTSLEITVSREFPLVTLVTMLAPSPDWFVGVTGLSLLEANEWTDQKTVFLYAWDAGTDSGASYRSSNLATLPPQPIQLATNLPFADAVPVGTFTFVRHETTPPPHLSLADGRFRVELLFQDFDGYRASGQPVQLSADTGYFWFFDEANVETVIKVIDGCGHNGHYWVFAGGLTNVEVLLAVEDTHSGVVRLYENPLGEAFEPIQDTEAFADCP